MPFQISRGLLAFAIAASCICGFSLIAQTPKVLLALSSPSTPPPAASPRNAHTLQPPPPAQPTWQVGSTYVASDYPEFAPEIQQDRLDSFQSAEPHFRRAAFSEPEFTTPPEIAPPPPSEEPLDFAAFEGDLDVEMGEGIDQFMADNFEATDFEPAAEQPIVPPSVELPEIERDSSDAQLGLAQSEPWPVEPSLIPEVVDEQAAAVVVSEPKELPVQSVGQVAYLGFAEPKATQTEVKRAVQGSYRIRSLVEPEKVPQRLRQAFRFSSPPALEVPDPVLAVRKVGKPAPCLKCRQQGAASRSGRVCSGCGRIHP